MPTPSRVALAVLAGILASVTPLRAQAVRGRLVAADSTPAAGAIVVLVDSTGTVVDRVLTTALGGFLAHAPREGRYTLRVLRIGFPAFEATGVVLRTGALADFSPILPNTPIVLNDIEVSSGSACSTDAAQGGATATLLEEVRKAFGAVDLALRDHDLRFTVHRFVRRTDKNAVLVAQDSADLTMASWPVHSLPAELLRDRGFVMAWDSVDVSYLPIGVSSGKVWFGPDPTTLFAGPFLATHCYRVQPDPRDSTRVGLTFAPVRGRHVPDITGTLWLTRSDLALRSLTYEYVNLPRQFHEARHGETGGTMDFLRLPTGLWVVAGWDLHAPVEEVYNNVPVGIAGYLEEGGRIAHITTTRGAVVY